MNDMVERVARAIAPMAWNSVNAGDTTGQKNRRKASLKHARAAIEAMREPTHEMLQSGHAVNFGYYPTQAWQAMIDAALSHQHPQPDIAEGVPRIDNAH